MMGIGWLLTVSAVIAAPEQIVLEDVQHVTVYYEAGRFGGWPANHGIWNWGDEIVVGYGRGYYKERRGHHFDPDRHEEHWLARSLDGGATWTLEHPAEQGILIPRGEALHGTEKPGLAIPPVKPSPGGINFAHPDFMMTVKTDNIHAGNSRFYYSYDRGKRWEGPFGLPNFDLPGTAARTDYQVEDEDSCMIFSTAAKSDGREGRVFCMRTDDGGKTWQFVSFIGEELEGNGRFGIMPASVRLGEQELLVAQRRRDKAERYIAVHRSMDNGKTWTREANPVDDLGTGNPPAMIQLADGRICLTYGYRAEPYSMCAKLSDDGGKTWGPELVLRSDGVTGDMGYSRTVQRADGKVVTVYYFCDGKRGPERYIAATIWAPPAK
jgi:hypothetical protein